MRKRLIQMAENYEESTGEEVWLHFGRSSPEKRPMSIGELSVSNSAGSLPQVQLLKDSAVCLDNVVQALGHYTATFQTLVAQLQGSVTALQRTLREIDDKQ